MNKLADIDEEFAIQQNERLSSDIIARPDLTAEHTMSFLHRVSARWEVSEIQKKEAIIAASQILAMQREAIVAQYEAELREQNIINFSEFQRRLKKLISRIQEELAEEEMNFFKLIQSSCEALVEQDHGFQKRIDSSDYSDAAKARLKETSQVVGIALEEKVKRRITLYIESYNKRFEDIFKRLSDEFRV